jgi:1-acyl-sn-glycerol-3-phosphate acyltransferase
MWVADCIVTTTGTPVRPHRGAFADALAHVRRGGRVWIAPEGGWQPELTLRYPRTGAVRLARAAGVPIQVLGVVHEPHPGPRLATWRPWHRPRIQLRWGEVLTTSGVLDDDIDRMMTAISAATGVTWTPPTTTG